MYVHLFFKFQNSLSGPDRTPQWDDFGVFDTPGFHNEQKQKVTCASELLNPPHY